jgi:PPIC-type PPIASE domain
VKPGRKSPNAIDYIPGHRQLPRSRFGMRRLVAAVGTRKLAGGAVAPKNFAAVETSPRRQVAQRESGDESPHSKALRALMPFAWLLLCTPLVCAEPAAVDEAAILAALTKLDPAEQAALAKDPALLKQVVQLTLVQRLLLHEARKNKWDEQPQAQGKIERAKDTALAESWLQSVAEPPADYPGDDELKAAWEARKDSFATPRQHRLAQIFIACQKSAGKAAIKKAEAKLAAVKAKLAAYQQDFAAIARAESDEPAAKETGGEIGWLSDAQIQPELRPHITRLLKHEVSAPVRLNDGWHILKCLDKREAGTPSFNEARPKLVIQLRAEKTKANSEAYVAKLLQSHPLKLDESALIDSVRPSTK